MSAPLGVLVLGALLGSGTGLMAVGLVLTYRSHRIVNFAYGGMGGAGAALAVGLHQGKGWPWFVAVIPGLLLGLGVGALTERIVLRRLEKSPRLVVTVATIGLAQLLAGLQAALPVLLGGPVLVGAFRTPLSSIKFTIEPLVISGNDLALLIVVPVVLGALSWFLLKSDAGIAVRGIAENADRARLLGLPVKNLSVLVWTIAGGLAALTVLLRVPNEGMNLNVAATGPQVMLPALAAAVVARLQSLPKAFFAGVALGILDQLARWNFDKQSTTSVILLIVILVALALQVRTGGRAEIAAGEGSWAVSGAVRPLPDAIRQLPVMRWARRGGLVGVVAAALLLPVVATASQMNLATIATAYAVVAVSLVVLTGWGGTVSLGQLAILGAGGVAAGDLIAKWNVDFFVAMLVAGVVGGVIAAIIALPALRVSGQLLAVTTLAFAVSVDTFFLNPTNFPWLVPGAFDRPVLLKRFAMREETTLYFVGLLVLLLAVAVARNLSVTRTRRAVIATRDNERAAASSAINVTRTKISAFVICGVLAGMAGAVHATALGAIGLRTYDTQLSILAFTTVVIGGVSSLSGALFAVVAVRLVVYLVPGLQLVATGVGVLLVLLVLPGGMAQAGANLRDRFARRLAARHNIRFDDNPTEDEQQVAHRQAAFETVDDPILTSRGVEAGYGQLQVLFGVDLDVRRGEVLALLGTNGAGKSTLLKAFTNLLNPSSGEITLDGKSMRKVDAEKMIGEGIALMPGGRGVFPTLTVLDNLRLACWPVRKEPGGFERVRDEAFALFPALARRTDTRAGDLSGGEQQMLSLAMALVVDPKVLCIDELSLGLAPTVVGELVDVVHAVNQRGTTVIVVEQSINVALLLAERAIFMEKGEVRFSGPTEGLLERDDILRAVFLGGSTEPVPRSRRRKSQSRDELPNVVEVAGISKSFGGVNVLNDVTFDVPAESIVGLIGHNGAGKTTLFDVMSGFLTPDHGVIRINGEDITGLAPHQRAWRGVGRSFQDARLYPGLTVADTVAVALDRHLASRDPLAAALRLPAAFDTDDAVAARVEELLEQVGLTRYRSYLTGELSTGTRRIVELACVLAQSPSVVLLDEPSAGVAQRETEALGPLLRKVQQDLGCAMVVVEHDMAMIGALCDQLVALELGEVITTGPPSEVLSHPRVIASYLGSDDRVVQRSGKAG